MRTCSVANVPQFRAHQDGEMTAHQHRQLSQQTWTLTWTEWRHQEQPLGVQPDLHLVLKQSLGNCNGELRNTSASSYQMEPLK